MKERLSGETEGWRGWERFFEKVMNELKSKGICRNKLGHLYVSFWGADQKGKSFKGGDTECTHAVSFVVQDP